MPAAKKCPLCHGEAQTFERTIGPGACCDGDRECPWYRVVVPLDAWERLPRPKEMRECIEATAKELNIVVTPDSDFGWVMRQLPSFAGNTEAARRRFFRELAELRRQKKET